METPSVPLDDVAHFKTFGFAIWRQLLRPEEVRAIEAELMTAMAEGYAEKPFDGTERHWLPLLSPRTPTIAALAEDPRFFRKAQALVDDDVVLLIADGNRYVSDTGWHPDAKDAHGVKFFIYLEPLTAESGALRVIPGSHLEPLHTAIGDYARKAQPAVEELPGFVCECRPGDVLAFDYPMWHASTGGSRDRRMCTIEYYRRPRDSVEARAVREHCSLVVETVEKVFPRAGFPFYDPRWRDDPQASGSRRELVEAMRDVGLFEAAAQRS